MKATGYTDEDIRRPRIGIANTWTELCPGHFHLRSVAEFVRAGIWQAGGVPFEFASFAQCPNIVGGRHGIRYDTPTRDIIAAEVEAAVELHMLDALVLICTCDKNVPGHLLAAARLNIPSIIVPGGPMLTGRFHGKEVYPNEVIAEGRRVALGTSSLSPEELAELEDVSCPGPGACAILGTANTMQCLAEALGMTLPGAATTPAVSAKRLRLAKESGIQVMRLLKMGLTPKDIMTADALENAVRVLHAIGGSTNAVVHLLALAEELDLHSAINIDLIDRLSEETPCITDVRPSGKFSVIDLDEAGGVQAVMRRLESTLHRTAMTVTGKTLAENLEHASVTRDEVIRTLDNPLYKGGLCVLRGNIARSAIIRPTVVAKNMLVHTGPARVFDCQEDALEAIKAHKIVAGDVVVIRYEGPRGGPGLTSVYGVVSWMSALGLTQSCAVVTDGKVSGFMTGPVIVQVTPEAAVGGPLAAVREGDMIEIDVPRKRLNLKVPSEEIDKRLREWTPRRPRVSKGILTVYSQIALQSDRGGGLGTGFEEE